IRAGSPARSSRSTAADRRPGSVCAPMPHDSRATAIPDRLHNGCAGCMPCRGRPDRPDPAARRLPMETREFAPSGTGTRSTREKIKAVAAELYVLRGHDGFSFGDIAGAIGTTRANIHHHFGSKRQLMEELIED